LTVVGDDAQSIYSFRAATVRNILDFPKHFTPPARIITLDRNYRSTQPILAAANAVIDQAVERHKKNLRSERPSAEQPQLVSVRDEIDQARYVVDRLLEYRELYQELGFPALKKGGYDKKLVGYFQADTGVINQLVHLWKFDDDADRRKHWAGVFADKDFVEGFASKFRPLVMTHRRSSC
jgi:hypothetical protein